MFCGNCGQEIKEGAKFCPKCGKVVCNTVLTENNRKTPLNKKLFSKIIALIIAVCIAVGGCAFGITYFQKEKSGERERGAGSNPKTVSEKEDAETGKTGLACVGIESTEVENEDDGTTVYYLYGIIDETGKEIVSCQYDEIGFFSENGLAAVKMGESWGYINTKGKEIIPCQYEYAGSFGNNGLACVKSNGEYGYINEKGEKVIPCQYEYADSFGVNGLACVKNQNGYGYIDKTGEEIISCRYDEASGFSLYNIARVKNAAGWGCINEKGDEIISCQYESMSGFSENGLAAVTKAGEDKIGFINESGKQVVPFQYIDTVSAVEEPGFFSGNGLTAVENEEEKWGYINENGEEIIPCQYEYASPFFKNGLAAVIKEDNEFGKMGFINKDGKQIVPCIYEESVYDFTDCFLINNDFLAVENKEGYVGYINKYGEEVIPCQYNGAKNFYGKSGLAQVLNEGRWGYIDEDGNDVIPCIYAETDNFGENGLAAVKNEDGKWGYINKKGEMVIHFQYDTAGSFQLVNGESEGAEDTSMNVSDANPLVEETEAGGKAEDNQSEKSGLSTDIKEDQEEMLSDGSVKDVIVSEEITDAQKLFYGIFCAASKNEKDLYKFIEPLNGVGLDAYVIDTIDWENLNREKWFVVTSGMYATEEEAENNLGTVKEIYPEAYVKYSGEHR